MISTFVKKSFYSQMFSKHLALLYTLKNALKPSFADMFVFLRSTYSVNVKMYF